MRTKSIVVKSLVMLIALFITQGIGFSYVNYGYPNGYYGYNSNSGENYLQITQIEKALFNRTYERESIYNRLSRIERKLFRTTNTRDSLADRLEAITQNINPSLMANVPLTELKRLEQRVLRQTYTYDDVHNRLARLEQVVLGATQAGNLDTRFQRLQLATRQNRINPYYNTPTAYNNNNSSTKNILNTLVNGIGTITGFTPPVYDPYLNNGFNNDNWGQSRFYADNQRIQNSFYGGNTGTMVRILD